MTRSGSTRQQSYRCMVEYKSRRGSHAQVSSVCGSKVGALARLIGVSPKASAGTATTLLERQLKALYCALERERDHCTTLLTLALAELDNPRSAVPARLVSPKANKLHGHLARAGSRDAVFRRPAVHSYRLRGLVHTRRGCPLFQVAQQHMIPCAAGCLCSDITYRSLLWRHSRQRGHRLRSRGDEDLSTRCHIREMLSEPLAEALDPLHRHRPWRE